MLKSREMMRIALHENNQSCVVPVSHFARTFSKSLLSCGNNEMHVEGLVLCDLSTLCSSFACYNRLAL